MAIVHGALIKEQRKKRKMSQTELAEGICKQATISNIERKNFCKDIEILSKVCRRLELTLNQVIQSSPEDWMDDKLNQVEELSRLNLHDEALEILNDIDQNDIKDNKVLNRYYYNQGNCLLLGKGDCDGALFYFNQVLNVTDDQDLYGILSNTGIAIVYEKKEQFNFAEIYYKKAIEGVHLAEEPRPLRFNGVLFNAAKFYSLIKKYETAIYLCDEGIKLNQAYESTQLLEYLYYEKAFNKHQLGDSEALDLYRDAKMMATFNKNQHVLDTIEKDLSNM